MSRVIGDVPQVRPLSQPYETKQADTLGAPGWVGRIPEEDWMMQLYEHYVRSTPLKLSPEESALSQYAAGERLQYMTRFSTDKNYGIHSTWVPDAAVGWWCPRTRNCDWCNCTLWPCTCGELPSNIAPPAKVPKGKARWCCPGGPDLLQQLMMAVGEGCTCVRGTKPLVACAADRIDCICYRGYHKTFDDRCRARLVMDARFRTLGLFKEEFEYEMLGNFKRSVSTQTYMEADGTTLWQGYGVRKLGLGTLWTSRQTHRNLNNLLRQGYLRQYDTGGLRTHKRGTCTCRPLHASSMKLYDLRGVEFSVRELPTEAYETEKKGVLHQILQLLKWDSLVKPSKLYNKVASMHSKRPDKPEPTLTIRK